MLFFGVLWGFGVAVWRLPWELCGVWSACSAQGVLVMGWRGVNLRGGENFQMVVVGVSMWKRDRSWGYTAGS